MHFDDGKTPPERVSDALRAEKNRICDDSHSKIDQLIAEAIAVGRVTTRQGLGQYGHSDLPYFDLERSNLHRLLVHTREDSATALAASIEGLRHAFKARRWALICCLLLIAILVVQLAILSRL